MSESALGVFGGTFDPVHYGHLRLAEEARSSLGLDRVLWLPAGQPPHRSAPRTAAHHRLEMVRLAIDGNPGFVLDQAEVLAESPSYTVTSLERLRSLHGPNKPLVLLLGADAFAGLTGWHRWQTLFDLAHVAVATRPSYPLESGLLPPTLETEFRKRLAPDAKALGQSPAGHVMAYAITALEISATAIRGALSADCSARYLLPDPVLDYIAEHRLYQ